MDWSAIQTQTLSRGEGTNFNLLSQNWQPAVASLWPYRAAGGPVPRGNSPSIEPFAGHQFAILACG
jgi:hypothetical protein